MRAHARLAMAVLLLTTAVPLVACSRGEEGPSIADLVARGDQFAEKQEFRDAASAYQQAVQRDPSNGDLRMKLAVANRELGRWVPATNEAIRAADLMPGHVEAELLAASLMLGQNRYLDVAERMAVFVRAHPDNARAYVYMGTARAQLLNETWALFSVPEAIRRGLSFEAARQAVRKGTSRTDDAAAEQALMKAVSLGPEMWETHLAYANFLWAANRLDDSEPALKKATSIATTHAVANHALGTYYLIRRRFPDAEHYLKIAGSTGPFGRDARFSLADLYLENGREADAVSLVTSMLEDDDASGEVSLRLANLELRAGKNAEAIARVDGLLKRFPAHALAAQLKARALLAQRDLDGALQIAKAAVALDVGASPAHAVLGDVYTARGSVRDAYTEYAEAFRLDPGNDALPLRLARAALGVGQAGEALQAARDAKRRHPDDPEARLILAKALLLNKEFAGAEAELRPLLASGNPSADLLVQQGTMHMGRGSRAAARASFASALSKDSQSFDAMAGLVRLDLAEGQTRAARERIERALAAHPDDPAHLTLASDVYVAAGDGAAAERTLTRLVAVRPDDANAAVALSTVLIQQRRSGEARQVLQQALDRQPQSLEAQKALAVSFEDAGQLEEARTRYENILARSPGQALIAARLAIVTVELKGNLDVALTLAGTSRRLTPNDPETASALGWVYVARSLLSRGIEQLQDAVKLAPDNPVYHYRLGYAHSRAGNTAAAKASLNKALALDPNFRYAAETRTLLATLR